MVSRRLALSLALLLSTAVAGRKILVSSDAGRTLEATAGGSGNDHGVGVTEDAGGGAASGGRARRVRVRQPPAPPEPPSSLLQRSHTASDRDSPPGEAMELRPGQLIEWRWPLQLQVERKLEAGGMGVVYSARVQGCSPSTGPDSDPDEDDSGKKVAVKVMHCCGPATDLFQFRMDVLHEVRAMQAVGKVSNTGFVKFLGHRLFEEQAYIVMQLASDDLYNAARKGLTVDMRGLVNAMSSSVGKMHQLGYAHRDIKPPNFLLDCVDGWCDTVLADFAFMCSVYGAHSGVPSCMEELDVGTESFFAPEAFNGDALWQRARALDLWALGRTLCMIAKLDHGESPTTGADSVASALDCLDNCLISERKDVVAFCPLLELLFQFDPAIREEAFNEWYGANTEVINGPGVFRNGGRHGRLQETAKCLVAA
mmetsp:Transcript_54870/g.159343  ORF Transcript_54870/g.159343 Transcript_54870/m.159343 type:complete len:425 (-) Transcript_54870:76-1350(-)